MLEGKSHFFGLVFFPPFFKKNATIKMSEPKIATKKTLMARGMYSGGLATVIVNVSELLIVVPRAFGPFCMFSSS
jgi:hypothetical protein